MFYKYQSGHVESGKMFPETEMHESIHPQQSRWDTGGQGLWQDQRGWYPKLQHTCFHGNQGRDCFALHQQATSCFNVKRQLAGINLCVVKKGPSKQIEFGKIRKKKKSNFLHLWRLLPPTRRCHPVILQWFFKTFSYFKWSRSWSSKRQQQEIL